MNVPIVKSVFYLNDAYLKNLEKSCDHLISGDLSRFTLHIWTQT